MMKKEENSLVAFPFRCVIAVFFWDLRHNATTTTTTKKIGCWNENYVINVWQAKYVYVSLLLDFGCRKLLWWDEPLLVYWIYFEHLGILSMQHWRCYYLVPDLIWLLSLQYLLCSLTSYLFRSRYSSLSLLVDSSSSSFFSFALFIT